MSSHRDRSRSPIQIRAPCERRVYVANIPFDMKWTELKDLFKRECGENSVSFVRYFEDTDGKFRGCGIVEFKDSEATKRAIEKLHRYELNGRFLVVKEDYDVERDSTGRVVTRRQRDRDGGHRDRSPPRRERSPPSRDYGGHGGHGGHGGSGGPGTGGVSFNTYGLSPKFLDSLGIELPLSNRLFIANLDYKVTKSDLKRLFKLCGRVLEVELYVDKDGNSKGNATVELDHPIEAVQAISMLNRQVYHGRSLAIRMDRKENEEPKLPPGLEGVGKGLGPGGVPLRLPRDFPPVGSAPAPPPQPSVPTPAPVPPVTANANPMAGLAALGNPSGAALAALSTVLGSLAAGQTGGGLFPGANSMGGGPMGGGGPGGMGTGAGSMGGGQMGSMNQMGSSMGSGKYGNDGHGLGGGGHGGMGGANGGGKYGADDDTKWRY